MSSRVIDGHKETLEGGIKSSRMILEAGGCLGMGGDYGFAWNPHGDYARELTFFVKDVGFTAEQVLKCATLNGAHILGRESELGTLQKGKLADVLVVRGNLLSDISILENRANIEAVFQGGILKAGRIAN
jgi:imidazolonepropionase-like amidohydrolase